MASISIGELLVDNGQITPEELEQAEAEIKKTGEPIAAVLSKLGFITENSLKNALELQYGVMYMNLSKREPEHELISLLPEQVIREQQAVPVSQQGDRLTVAMVDPNDSKAFEVVSKSVRGGKQVKAVVCLEEQFIKFVDQAFGTTSNGNGTPKAEAAVAEAAKPESTVAETPKSESATEETAKSESTVAEAPKSESATEEAPKPESPVAEAPKSESATEEGGKPESAGTEALKSESTTAEATATESPVSAKVDESSETKASDSTTVDESSTSKSADVSSTSKSTDSAKSDESKSESKMYSEQPTFDTQEMKARPAPGSAEAAAANAPAQEEEPAPKSESSEGEHDLAKRAQEEAIVLLANQILGSAIKRHCSNIHITMHQRESLVHYRMNGRLILDRKLPNTIVTALVARYKMMARLNLAERKEPQDGHIKVKSASKEIVCLISVVPQDHGENVVIWIV